MRVWPLAGAMRNSRSVFRTVMRALGMVLSSCSMTMSASCHASSPAALSAFTRCARSQSVLRAVRWAFASSIARCAAMTTAVACAGGGTSSVGELAVFKWKHRGLLPCAPLTGRAPTATLTRWNALVRVRPPAGPHVTWPGRSHTRYRQPAARPSALRYCAIGTGLKFCVGRGRMQLDDERHSTSLMIMHVGTNALVLGAASRRANLAPAHGSRPSLHGTGAPGWQACDAVPLVRGRRPNFAVARGSTATWPAAQSPAVAARGTGEIRDNRALRCRYSRARYADGLPRTAKDERLPSACH